MCWDQSFAIFLEVLQSLAISMCWDQRFCLFKRGHIERDSVFFFSVLCQRFHCYCTGLVTEKNHLHFISAGSIEWFFHPVSSVQLSGKLQGVHPRVRSLATTKHLPTRHTICPLHRYNIIEDNIIDIGIK